MVVSWLIHSVFYLLTFWLGVKHKKIMQVNGKNNAILALILMLLSIIFIAGLFNYGGLCDNLFKNR